MNKAKKLFLVLMTMVTLLFGSISVAQASTFGFSYDGNRIIGKESVNSTSVNSGAKIKVVHSQTRNYNANYSMTVKVLKKGFWGSTTVAQKTFNNDVVNKSFTTTAPSSGTYKLRFDSSAAGSSMGFKINGIFYK